MRLGQMFCAERRAFVLALFACGLLAAGVTVFLRRIHVASAAEHLPSFHHSVEEAIDAGLQRCDELSAGNMKGHRLVAVLARFVAVTASAAESQIWSAPLIPSRA